MFLIQQLSFFFLFLATTVLSVITLFFTIRLEKRPVGPGEESPGQEGSLISWRTLPVAIVSFFSHTNWGALTAFFPLYALQQGMSNPGLFFAVFAVMLILGRTLGARIFDRYSRDKIILPCLILFILAMTLLSFSKSVPMFFLVAVIWGAGNAFLFPTLVALTLDLTGPSRGPAMGTFTAISDLGVALGAVIMGLVLRKTNYQTMFFCLVLCGLINFFYFNFYVRKKIRKREFEMRGARGPV
jgi:MFS family permease